VALRALLKHGHFLAKHGWVPQGAARREHPPNGSPNAVVIWLLQAFGLLGELGWFRGTMGGGGTMGPGMGR
jgi:hypothetical protein